MNDKLLPDAELGRLDTGLHVLNRLPKILNLSFILVEVEQLTLGDDLGHLNGFAVRVLIVFFCFIIAEHCEWPVLLIFFRLGVVLRGLRFRCRRERLLPIKF